MFKFIFFVLIVSPFSSCGRFGIGVVPITKVEMKLSAFGVESDRIPNINAVLDFTKDTSLCDRSYYGPVLKSPVYKLSKAEMKEVLRLLQKSDLNLLKHNYTTKKTDQPTSFVTVYQGDKKYTFKDYGLEAPSPLKDVYKIVYKY